MNRTVWNKKRSPAEVTEARKRRVEAAEAADPDRAVERAKNACLRLLGYRARSEAELRQRLEKKGYSSAVIRRVLLDLRGMGLINDREFARAWVESRIALRPLGAASLRWELRRRGIDDTVAEVVIRQALGTEGEYKLAKELAESRIRKARRVSSGDPSSRAPLERAELARLGRFLAGRGFSYQVVREVIHSISGQEAADES